MNIITRPYAGEYCYCRPDTTWERESKDFYVPEGIGQVQWAPVVFVRISKAGKCIGRKFASRYYDAFNFGALMYCIPQKASSGGTEENTGLPVAFTSCTDHTSLLPFPLYNMVVMENKDNIFVVEKDGNVIFSTADGSMTSEMLADMLEETICRASQQTSIRIGDFVAVELKPVAALADRMDGDAAIKAAYCNNGSFDFKIIF